MHQHYRKEEGFNADSKESIAPASMVGTPPGVRIGYRRRTKLGAGHRGGRRLMGGAVEGGGCAVRVRTGRNRAAACVYMLRHDLQRRWLPLHQVSDH